MSDLGAAREIPAELVGTWRLVRYDDRDADGLPWRPTLGERFEGYVGYDAAGLWTVQISVPGDHIAYYGPARVREVTREGGVLRGVLEVDVRGSSHEAGFEYADRPIVVREDRLVVGDQRTWIREATRVV